MKVLIVLPAFIMVLGGFRTITTSNNIKAHWISDSLQGTILVINSFDAMTLKARKNKNVLFRELADSLKLYLYRNLLARNKSGVILIPELLANKEDSVIYSLMAQHNAARAIVIKKVNAYFNQTGVEVVKEADGKQRTASYDICAAVNYTYYSIKTKPKESETIQCEFFTTRGVMSGLFAAGPDIVGKSKHAHKIIAQNADQYLREINSLLSEE